MNKQGKFKEIIRKSLAEQVAERLKEALLNGEFPPSRRIPEERLAAAFQISRTPLRQAMQHLERVGLLERHPSGGMQPATITLQDVTDAVALRAHTEGLLARRAAQNATQEEILQLEAYSQMFNISKSLKNTSQLIDINEKIHFLVREAARSPLLVRLLNDLDSRIEPILRHYIHSVAAGMPAARSHDEIVVNIRNRNGDEAMEAMRTHVLFAGNIAITYMKAKQDQE